MSHVTFTFTMLNPLCIRDHQSKFTQQQGGWINVQVKSSVQWSIPSCTSLVPGAHENVQTWAHQGTLAAPDRPLPKRPETFTHPHNSTGNARDIFPNVAVVHLHVYFLNLVLQVKSNYFHLSHWKSMKISDHPVFHQILWPFSPRKSPSFSRSQTFPAANPRPSRAVQGQWWRPLPGWNLQRPSARNGSVGWWPLRSSFEKSP